MRGRIRRKPHGCVERGEHAWTVVNCSVFFGQARKNAATAASALAAGSALTCALVTRIVD
jgi:hypothetical protein